MRTIAFQLRALMRTDVVVFCCVGALNTALHAGVVITLVELADLGSTLANTAAFFVANVFSYVLNSLFTFNTALSAGRYVRFLSSSLVVLLCTITIAALCESAGIHYMLATLSLMIVSPILSFLMIKHFAFGGASRG